MKKNQHISVKVTGKGNSKQQAFASALAQVQPQVLKNSQHIILRIEPLDIDIISAQEKLTTEKFLFFFLPRKKAFYEVMLNISVDVTFIDMNNIEFIHK